MFHHRQAWDGVKGALFFDAKGGICSTVDSSDALVYSSDADEFYSAVTIYNGPPQQEHASKGSLPLQEITNIESCVETQQD